MLSKGLSLCHPSIHLFPQQPGPALRADLVPTSGKTVTDREVSREGRKQTATKLRGLSKR